MGARGSGKEWDYQDLKCHGVGREGISILGFWGLLYLEQ